MYIFGYSPIPTFKVYRLTPDLQVITLETKGVLVNMSMILVLFLLFSTYNWIYDIACPYLKMWWQKWKNGIYSATHHLDILEIPYPVPLHQMQYLLGKCRVHWLHLEIVLCCLFFQIMMLIYSRSCVANNVSKWDLSLLIINSWLNSGSCVLNNWWPTSIGGVS
jgi:hypothetical protein